MNGKRADAPLTAEAMLKEALSSPKKGEQPGQQAPQTGSSKKLDKKQIQSKTKDAANPEK